MRRARALVLVAAITATVGISSAALATSSTSRGQFIAHSAAADAIPGAYIVQLRTPLSGAVHAVATALLGKYGGQLGFVYESALQGFSVHGLSQAAAEQMAASPFVRSVEQDIRVHATATTTEENAPNGVDRLDQTATALDGRYTYTATGSGVHVYGIDTGIRTTHQDFGGRAQAGYSAVNDSYGSNDCDSVDHGHGTNTASLAVGTTFGVAKKATITAVRVLDCKGNGSSSQVIAGLNWVASNAVRPAVATLSIGSCGQNSAEDDAVENVISKGITAVVAAGNGSGCSSSADGSGMDACNTSPSDVADAIVVAAIDDTLNRPSWSNYGRCVSISAPGVNVIGAGNASNTATVTLSGTSQATPLVAGAVAQYLSLHTTASPALVKRDILAAAAKGVKSGQGSPDRIVNTLFMNSTSSSPTSNPPATSAPSPAPGSTDCGPCYPRPILRVATGGGGKANMLVTVRHELAGKTMYFFVRSGSSGQVRSLGAATVSSGGYAERDLTGLRVGQAMRVYAKINDAPSISNPRSNDVDFHVQ